jgi:L-alanine-DL-glutamate epimerase-like enolase superfamily enzyme
MSSIRISAEIIRKPLVKPFVIATGPRDHQDVLSVTITDGHYTGRGMATGVKYLGLTPDVCLSQIQKVQSQITDSTTRADLLRMMPPNGGRFALDSAFWELEAARNKTTVADITGLSPKPLRSAYTIVLDTPEAMAAQAKTESWRPFLKVKLGGSAYLEIQRMKAVRAAAPDCVLVIDANAAWTREQLAAYLPVLSELGYSLLEQPLAIGRDKGLMGISMEVPICADESFQTIHNLERVKKHYDAINIKLDKCGGLTSALLIEKEARKRGLDVFVGCMLAPTEAIAPAFLLAQKADYVDLDGPFWFKDKDPRVKLTDDGLFDTIPDDIWGAGLIN